MGTLTSAMVWPALLAAAQAMAQTAAPPVAVPRTVNDSFFGRTVADDYRYFEDPRDREAARWMQAHGERAAATLAALPGRNALLAAITAHEAAAPDTLAPVQQRPGGLVFSQRRGAGDAQSQLVVRRGAGGADRLLVDPGRLALGSWQPSPDGRRLAYTLVTPGSEQATLQVLDVVSGRPVGTPLAHVNPDGIDWAPDGRQLAVGRLPLPRADRPESSDYGQVLLQPVDRALAGGRNPARPVFGRGVRTAEVAVGELPSVQFGHDGRWAFGVTVNGVQRELGLAVAAQAGVLAGRPAWRRVAERADGVLAFAAFGDTLYLLSHQGAPRGQVWALDLRRPDVARARVVVAESRQVITDIGAAADALYIETRDGAAKRLYKRAHAADAPGATVPVVEVLLPAPATFQLTDDNGGRATDPRRPGALLGVQGWTTPRRLLAVAADGSVSDAGLQPPHAPAPPPAPARSDIVSTEWRVPSHDGALVPLTLLHRRGLALDGSHPTLLLAYAAYGLTEEPEYKAGRQAWLDAGGVLAIANPRGSGADGEAWYRSGWQASKPNGWKDLIACAEYLVTEGWTRPARLGLMGRSAGGIVAGRAMTERPDLFAAVVLQVAALDALRWEFAPNGAPNVPEFGSVTNEAGFRALLAMSTYANIRAGTAYPAVLLTHGVQDPRVPVWESAKTAARLLAASTSGKPVLLRLDYAAGHGLLSTARQLREERADIYAFLRWQMGMPPPP